MSLSIYYLLFATILLFAGVATFLVGISKKNKEGDPVYDSKTKSYWSRLSWIYMVVIVIGYITFFIYIMKSHS